MVREFDDLHEIMFKLFEKEGFRRIIEWLLKMGEWNSTTSHELKKASDFASTSTAASRRERRR